jgi:four helix bundle protein
MSNPAQLQERVTNFSVAVLSCSKKIDKSFAGQHLYKQLVRSATSCALNYGEARSAESRNDFLHKMKIVLKELRETQINMQLLFRSGMLSQATELEKITQENNELISIFVKSVNTARSGVSQ